MPTPLTTTGQASFAVAGYMRNLALYSIAAEYNRRVVLSQQSDLTIAMYISTGDPETSGWLQGERSLDFTAALRPDERKHSSWQRLLHLLQRSFGLRPPPGIRHDNMPAYVGVVYKRGEITTNHHHLVHTHTELVLWHAAAHWC